MKERNIQTLFGRKNTMMGVFELKLVKGRSMPFNAVAEHQVRALSRVERGGLYHKISDASYEKKPFDCFRLEGVPAYVVPVWYVPRERKTAYYIRIGKFCELRDACGRKSLTETIAKEYADNFMEL